MSGMLLHSLVCLGKPSNYSSGLQDTSCGQVLVQQEGISPQQGVLPNDFFKACTGLCLALFRATQTLAVTAVPTAVSSATGAIAASKGAISRDRGAAIIGRKHGGPSDALGPDLRVALSSLSITVYIQCGHSPIWCGHIWYSFGFMYCVDHQHQVLHGAGGGSTGETAHKGEHPAALDPGGGPPAPPG